MRKAVAMTTVAGLLVVGTPAVASADASCWGQATKAFASTGTMGQHASEQEEPRLGLRNVARALADAGVLADDSLEALGAFLASASGLEVAACD